MPLRTARLLPIALASTLETTLGRIAETVPVGGGDISSAARVHLVYDVWFLFDDRVDTSYNLYCKYSNLFPLVTEF